MGCRFSVAKREQSRQHRRNQRDAGDVLAFEGRGHGGKVLAMAQKYIKCDVCNKEKGSWDEFIFRGCTSFKDKKLMGSEVEYSIDYWKGDICFDCQYKMRKSVGLITLRGKGNE